MKKNREKALLTGVCAGIADHLGTETAYIRLLFGLGFLFFGVGPLVYLVLWICME